MIPSVVVERKNLSEIVPQLKTLKQHIPASFVGVFGLDYLGKVLKSLIAPVSFLIILLGFGAGFLFASFFESSGILFQQLFSFIPLIIAVYFIALIKTIIRIFTESAKVIYFTILYTMVQTPNKIRRDMKEDLTKFLKMEDVK